MKKRNNLLKATLSALTILSTIGMTSCQKKGGNNSQVNGQVEYKVIIKTDSGVGIEGVTVEVFKDGSSVKFNSTDSNGNVSFLLDAGDYEIKIVNYIDQIGELEQDTFQVTSTNREVNISVKQTVIPHSAPIDHSYKIGNQMYDFTLQDAQNKAVIQLSDLLKDNKMVMLNFWFSTCSPCIKEMPYFVEAYEEYKNDVEIIAINPYATDSEAAVKDFKEKNGINFTMCKDTIDLYTHFNVLKFPTTVVIDRFGKICYWVEGGFNDEEEVKGVFEFFTSDNYTSSRIFEDGVIRNKPNITMPASSELEKVANGNNFNGTYRPETSENDAEWTWPWIVDPEKNAIKPSNYNEVSSFSTFYCDFTCEKDDVLAFDFYCSTEEKDIVYILVDGTIYQRISGASTSWQTCYAYVAGSSGKHTLAVSYVKDQSKNYGDDTIYMKNIRLASTSDIDTPTYIIREMANGLDEKTHTYSTYVQPIYNEEDGYYHVESKDGPLLLANMLKPSNWSNVFFYDYVYEKQFEASTNDPSKLLTEYAGYASNSLVTGFTPVTQELKDAIKRAMEIFAEKEHRQTYDNEWLEICCYYAAYGTNGVQLENPIKGVAKFEAYKGHIGENKVNFQVPVMPRGLITEFTPETTGIYEIIGTTNSETNIWVVDEEGHLLTDEFLGFRDSLLRDQSDQNFMVYVRFEEGKKYYITTAFYDFYEMGELTFNINYKGAEGQYLRLCSHGAFTSEDVSGDNLPSGDIITSGIKVALDDDGYYHQLLEDGTMGSIVYADWGSTTNIFPNNTLCEMVELGAFDFTKDEEGFPVDDQTAEDLTALARKYKEIAEEGDPESELYGLIPVDEELAELLQKLLEKYTFEGVENAWTTISYYYESFN